MFPVEKMLHVIAGMKGTYVLSLLDCTREKLDSSTWRGIGNQSELTPELESLFAAQDAV